MPPDVALWQWKERNISETILRCDSTTATMNYVIIIMILFRKKGKGRKEREVKTDKGSGESGREKEKENPLKPSTFPLLSFSARAEDDRLPVSRRISL